MIGKFAVVGASDPAEQWPTDRRAVITVPGEEAVVLAFDVPERMRRGAAERIMSHALEDMVGERREEIHAVRLPRDRDDTPGRARAIVIRRERISGVLEQAERRGTGVAAVLPDYLVLPWRQEGWTVALEHGRVRARLGRLDGFAAEPELAAALLQKRLETAPAPPAHVLVVGEPGSEHGVLGDVLERLENAGARLDRPGEHETAPLKHGEMQANLLTGEFSDTHGLVSGLARWRVPAMLAAAALLVWAADGLLALRSQQATLEDLDRRIESIFREQFEPAGPIVDVRVQAARRLDALRGQLAAPRRRDLFLELLDASGSTLAADTRRVSRLSYREGVLNAEVTLADFRALETLQASLAENGLEVEVVSSSASGGEGVEATLALRPGEAPDG